MSEEFDGAFCKKCNQLFFGPTDPCPACKEPTEKSKWRKRIRIERLAVAGTIAVTAGVIGLTISSQPEVGLTVLAVAGLGLLSAIHTANFLFGFGGGFVERIFDGHEPPHAHKTFDSGEYGMEFVRLLGIVLALFVIIGIYKLIAGR